jgi:hypothetical protein
MNLTDLIAAIATCIRESGGATTKTKILKLLYLLDIESYRKSEATVTGFDWKFYRFGPWAASYDDALQAAVQANKISINAPNSDEGATFINPIEKLSLDRIFPNVVQQLTAKRIIETWAARPTVELLDYVYFHTAPMRDAIRNERLDFSTVMREEKLSHYTGIKSQIDEKERQRKRKELLRRLSSITKAPIAPLDPPPRYDDNYWSALAKLDSDAD